MVVSKNFLFVKQFEGEPKESDFRLVEEELPPLNDGEFRTEGLCWSVDPYMRVYVKVYNHPLNTVMLGGQIAKVIESKNPDYNVGDLVYAHVGWRTHTNVKKEEEKKDPFSTIYKLPDFEGLPPSLGLGVLGMPGNTAYFGFLEICKPVAGETVVVSGAAGAVGSHVGQIAKIKGCRVIGIAGSDEKVKWLEEELKFDKAINYKTADVVKEIKKAAPNGVDCYFDNVGGTISSKVISQMNHMGRIAVCGSVSAYNCEFNNLPEAPIIQPSMILNQLKMEGFVVYRWSDRWVEGIKQNVEWIKLGKLKYKETITKGFENLPKAFIGMLKGDNFGKAVVYSSHL
ncbi:UNVERIFIED_CONTAM: hypothetical protein PYX00_005493 [Menopon gallinae]|uniref:Prostaglandin reductase 1 n=1 Tax=Menopon gallinae TaxID=328185 RepID=A0AAW2HRR2_9NEOP